MNYYLIYGSIIETDLDFPQLVKTDATQRPDIQICAGEMPTVILEKEKQDIYYEIGDTVSWINNPTCMFVVENGEKITYYLNPGEKRMRLLNYLLGFGMCMLFLQRGDMMIHCSALHNGKEAILIAGESGSGKSTTTDSYLANGWSLMADDVALVRFEKEFGKTMVYPAFPFTKLCRNTAVERGYNLEEMIYINEDRDKFLVPYQGEFDVTPKPLSKFIMLKVYGGEEVISQEISGFDKFKVCVNNLGLRHLLGQQKYAPHIGQKCLELIANVDVHLIARPAGKDTTEEIKKAAFDIIL
ncbi:MAG: hypothetical protein IJ420_05160 [Lachnospiraceae bacterium]|nr:hypothetical protein [Lachnospiraceae bacterium]